MSNRSPEHHEINRSLLPIITPETETGMRIKYDERQNPTQSWPEHLAHLSADIQQNNPGLSGFIAGQLEKYPKSMHPHILNVVVGTLAVLNEQMHNDALHQHTGL